MCSCDAGQFTGGLMSQKTVVQAYYYWLYLFCSDMNLYKSVNVFISNYIGYCPSVFRLSMGIFYKDFCFAQTWVSQAGVWLWNIWRG